MAVIDAHLHVWDLERASYPWLTAALDPINVSLDIDQVRPDFRAAGVDEVVLVQAADSAEDTDNMLEVAARAPEVVGVVGWVPLDDAETTAARIEVLRRNPVFVGVRSLIHDRADREWIVRPEIDDALTVVEASTVTFDYVTADPDALRHLPTICARHPDLFVVIDHLGKPPVRGTAEGRRRWLELLTISAEAPNVYAKISGLYPAGRDPSAWAIEDLRPFVADALEVFGPQRLMFGSDWPMSVLAGGYRRVWSAISTLVDELDAIDRAAVLGSTAAQFYGLGRNAAREEDIH